MDALNSVFVQSLAYAALSVVLGALVGVLWFGWQWLRQQQVHGWAAILVRSADQMLAGSTNEEKLVYVLDALERLFPRLDKALLRATIEASVQQVKLERQEIDALRIDRPS